MISRRIKEWVYEYIAPPLLTSVADWGEWSASRPGRSMCGKGTPGTHRIGSWVEHRNDLCVMETLSLVGTYCLHPRCGRVSQARNQQNRAASWARICLFLPFLVFGPVNGGKRFLQNVESLMIIALQPRRLFTWYQSLPNKYIYYFIENNLICKNLY
jgi:hypothetical protein